MEKPSHLQGVSLLPAINGKELANRAIYFESLYPYYSRGWAPLKGFIRGDEKFIDSPIPEFYDLEKDFDETKNLAETKNLDKYRDRLAKLIEEQSSTGEVESKQKIDRETREKLQSLGYISAPPTKRKETFTPEDDLKVLLPYQEKLMKAMGAYHRGEIDEGIKILKEIVAERADFNLAYTYLATLYKEQNKLREAVEILEKGFEKNPSSYQIIVSFGLFLTEVGQYDAAVKILETGLAIMDYDPELWNYLGVAYWKEGDFEKAQEAYEKALSLDHNYPIAFNNLGSLYLSISITEKKVEPLRKAMRNFKKAIELDPNYPSPYNGLGAVYRQAGNIEGAIYCWKKTLELKPDFAFALYNLGLTYLAKGEKNQALSYFTIYKKEHYNSLSPRGKDELDTLIQKCREKT